MIPVYKICVPEYHIREKPDWKTLGAKIDKKLKRHFMGKSVAIRCIGSQEHKGKSIDELVRIIRKLGHDRYDPDRKGDRYKNVEGKHIDFFALDFKIRPCTVIMEKFIEPFYTWPVKARDSPPIRLDLAIIYDRAQVKCQLHHYEGGRRQERWVRFPRPRTEKGSDNRDSEDPLKKRSTQQIITRRPLHRRLHLLHRRRSR